MSAPAIRTENLGKRYRIGKRERYKALRDTLTDLLRLPASLLARARGEARPEDPQATLWAVREFSIEVQPGEVIGVVGRNGSGKSTLLKLLSRVTEPTEGRAMMRGRVGPLLEVGTGFHPELTGRENIYLNGAILGMKRAEIRRKFDEIVAFSELEQFLDTPVKHYSSGMYVRLAFGVAAHLETEILLVDEVLAVGDATFQKKCMTRMGAATADGRTVLVVSHNMGVIRQLCRRTILIDGGRKVMDGPTENALAAYSRGVEDAPFDGQTGLSNRLDRSSGKVRLTAIRAQSPDGAQRWSFRSGETIELAIDYTMIAEARDVWLYVGLHSGPASDVVTTIKEQLAERIEAGRTGTITVALPEVALRPGDYYLYLWVGNSAGECFDVVEYKSISLPPLSIFSGELDAHRATGYFSIPYRVRRTES